MKVRIKERFVLLAVLMVFGFGGFTVASGAITGSGMADDPYLIKDLLDFQAFCGNTDYWKSGVHTRLENDIDLTSMGTYTHAPIAGGNYVNYAYEGTSYKGVFDGNDHVISNLTLNGAFYCGLFGQISENSSIANLNVENIYVTCSGFYGGGLVSYNNLGSISNCHVTGSLIGRQWVGGVVGMNSGMVSDCFTTISISGDTPHNTGGLIGRNDYNGNVNACYAGGAVDGGGNVGGLVGQNLGTITTSYSTCSVSGMSRTGGLVGENADTIANCYSTGYVTGSHFFAGSLVGENEGTVSMCYATGSVTGPGPIGGLVGTNESEDHVPGTIIGSFWDLESSEISDGAGSGDSTGALGKNTTEMQSQLTFTNAGWDFGGVWVMGMGQYPMLSPRISGDVNSDGVVNMLDLSLLAGNWLAVAE